MKQGQMYLVLELTMMKVKQQHLGVVFKQEHNGVIVDSVGPQSAAYEAGLKPGDLLLAVENRNVSSMAQVAKFIKSISGVNINLRIERATTNYVLRMKVAEEIEIKTPITNSNMDDEDMGNIVDDVDSMKSDDITTYADDGVKRLKSTSNLEKAKGEKVSKTLMSNNENVSKFAQTLGTFSLRKRKPSVDKASNDSSNRSTPTASNPGTPQHVFKQHNIVVPSSLLSAKKHSISEVPEIVLTDSNTKVRSFIYLENMYVVSFGVLKTFKLNGIKY